MKSTAPRRNPKLRWIAIGLAATVAAAVLLVVIKNATGYSSFDVTVNGFSYEVTVSDVRQATSSNGSIAKPGYAFVQVIMKVVNLQSDRMAPMIDSIDAIAASPGHFDISGTSITGAQYCSVGGGGPGEVSTGIAGAPPGWCFLGVAAEQKSQSAQVSHGPLAAGETIYQTYNSSAAFPSSTALSTFHVYGLTGGTETRRAQDLDLGAAG